MIAVRTALQYGAANHPELLQRQDVFALASYRVLLDIRRALCPDAPEMPDYENLSSLWLEDLAQIRDYEYEERERRKMGRQ